MDSRTFLGGARGTAARSQPARCGGDVGAGGGSGGESAAAAAGGPAGEVGGSAGDGDRVLVIYGADGDGGGPVGGVQDQVQTLFALPPAVGDVLQEAVDHLGWQVGEGGAVVQVDGMQPDLAGAQPGGL